MPVRAWVLQRLLSLPLLAEEAVVAYLGWTAIWDDFRHQTLHQIAQALLPRDEQRPEPGGVPWSQSLAIRQWPQPAEWLGPEQRRELRNWRPRGSYIISTGNSRSAGELAQAQAGRVFVRNLLNLRARYQPNLAVVARAHRLMTRDRPLYQNLVLSLRFRERNPDNPAYRLRDEALPPNIPLLVHQLRAANFVLLNLLEGVRELQDIAENLPQLSLRTPAGEERFCKPIVYIEGRSVRILCRSYGIHFWMLEAAPDDEPAQLYRTVGDMFWRPRAPEQARILPGLQA